MDYICPQTERERDSRGQSFFNKEDQMLTPRAFDSSFSLLFVYNHFALHFLLFTTSVGLPGSVSRTLVLTDALNPNSWYFCIFVLDFEILSDFVLFCQTLYRGPWC
jgi:hypothetical protein